MAKSVNLKAGALEGEGKGGDTVAIHSCLIGGYREEEITISESLTERRSGNSHKLQREHQLDARKLFSRVWLKLNLFDSTVDSPKCD